MATLLEVLKDKTSRKQFVNSLLTYLILGAIIFFIGFFAAYVYNSLFPKLGGDIQQQIDNTLNTNQTELKVPPHMQ